jgi:hypothetical protein
VLSTLVPRPARSVFPHRLRRPVLAAAAAGAVLALAFAAPAVAAVSPTLPVGPIGPPIGPNQAFQGVVNGATSDAVLIDGCSGPGSGPADYGYLIPGQYAEVIPAPTTPPLPASATGFTGSAGTEVGVTIVIVSPDSATSSITLTPLTNYDDPVDIPQAQVPCDAQADVVFTPLPWTETARQEVMAAVVEP